MLWGSFSLLVVLVAYGAFLLTQTHADREDDEVELTAEDVQGGLLRRHAGGAGEADRSHAAAKVDPIQEDEVQTRRKGARRPYRRSVVDSLEPSMPQVPVYLNLSAAPEHEAHAYLNLSVGSEHGAHGVPDDPVYDHELDSDTDDKGYGNNGDAGKIMKSCQAEQPFPVGGILGSQGVRIWDSKFEMSTGGSNADSEFYLGPTKCLGAGIYLSAALGVERMSEEDFELSHCSVEAGGINDGGNFKAQVKWGILKSTNVLCKRYTQATLTMLKAQDQCCSGYAYPRFLPPDRAFDHANKNTAVVVYACTVPFHKEGDECPVASNSVFKGDTNDAFKAEKHRPPVYGDFCGSSEDGQSLWCNPDNGGKCTLYSKRRTFDKLNRFRGVGQ